MPDARRAGTTTPSRRWTGPVLWASFLAVAVASAFQALRRPGYDRLADLQVYLGAIDAVRHGQPLYDYAAANGDPFTYPPFALLVLWPAGWLTEPAARVVWLAATVLAVAALAMAGAVRWPGRVPGRRRVLAALIALVLIVSAPVQSDLRMGQVSLFVVLLTLVDALELVPPRWRGLLVGIAGAIKLTPLLFVPYYWVSGRRRDAARALAGFAGASLIGLLVLPGDSLRYWLSAVFTTSRIGDLASLGNQSVQGMLIRAGLPLRALPLVWLVLVALICAVALWRAGGLARAGRRTEAGVLIGCATVAASPVSWTHHQVWTVLAAMLLIGGGRPVRRTAGAFLLVAMILSVGNVAAWLIPGSTAVFLFDNARALGAVAVCCAGFGAAATAVRARPDTAPIGGAGKVARSPWAAAVAVAATLVVGAAIFTVMPLPARSDPALRAYTQADFDAGRLPSGDQQGFTCPADSCDDLTFGGQLPLNYSVGYDGSTSSITGAVDPERIARLVYLAAPGAAQFTVPVFQYSDHRWGFALQATTSWYAHLRGYDRQGRLVISTGGKFQT